MEGTCISSSRISMEDLVYGKGIMKPRLVSKTMDESDSSAQLYIHWRMFARELGLRDKEIVRMELNITLQDLPLDDILHQLLSKWKALTGSKATLKKLYDSLIACSLKDIAEYLEKRFCHPKLVEVDKTDCEITMIERYEKEQKITLTSTKRGKVFKTDYKLLGYALAANVVIALVAPIGVSLAVLGFTAACYLPKIVDKFSKWSDELRTVSEKLASGLKKKKS